LNSPETPIYSKSRVLYHLDSAGNTIRKLDFALLVEGYMDCIAVASCGLENVVASCGTSLTEAQVRLLARYSRRVVVNYDPDSAGVAATDRSLALLLEEGLEAKVLTLPGGLDPDAFIRRRGEAEYKNALAQAPTFFDYVTARALAQRDVSTPEGKVAAANAVLPYLSRVPNPLLRAELANRLAEQLRLDERLLRDELKRAAGQGRSEIKAERLPDSTSPGAAEKQLLRAVLEDEALAVEYLPSLVETGVLEGLATERIFTELLAARLRGEKLDLGNWAESLGADDQRLVYQSAFWGVDLSAEQTALSTIALRRRKAELQARKLLTEIREAERQKDSLRLAQLLEAKAKLAKELAKGKRS
jgi:DNA primase